MFFLNRPTDVTKEAFDMRLMEWIDEAEEILKIIQYGARVAHEEGLINQNKDTRQKRFFISGIASLLLDNTEWPSEMYTHINI